MWKSEQPNTHIKKYCLLIYYVNIKETVVIIVVFANELFSDQTSNLWSEWKFKENEALRGKRNIFVKQKNSGSLRLCKIQLWYFQ